LLVVPTNLGASGTNTDVNKAPIRGPIAYAEGPFLITPLLELRTAGIDGVSIYRTTTNTKEVLAVGGTTHCSVNSSRTVTGCDL
jgi:hypothetical protein